MKKHKCVIADGHHRYKTSLYYSKKDGYNYITACFVDSFNEGLIVLPTNRLIFGVKSDAGNLIKSISTYFNVEEIGNIKEIPKMLETTQLINKKSKIKNHAFGFYDNINKKSYFLKLKDINLLSSYFKDKSEAYKNLDVGILHKIIIGKILGVDEIKQEKGTNIEFVKGTEETIKKLKDEKYQFAFFLNPPLIEDIFSTAGANEIMPQKSTYFYPKLYSGLVINKIK